MVTMGLFKRPDARPIAPEERLQAAQVLNGQALAELHDQFYPVVHRYVAYRLGNPDVVDDIVAETFLRLLETLQKSGSQVRDFRAYLLGTAAHLINDHLRQKYRHGENGLDPDNDTIPDGDPLEDRSDEHLRYQAVRRALTRLTPDQQHVLALRFSQDLSLEETAMILGKSVGAVKVLQFRAVASLRRILDEESEL